MAMAIPRCPRRVPRGRRLRCGRRASPSNTPSGLRTTASASRRWHSPTSQDASMMRPAWSADEGLPWCFYYAMRTCQAGAALCELSEAHDARTVPRTAPARRPARLPPAFPRPHLYPRTSCIMNSVQARWQPIIAAAADARTHSAKPGRPESLALASHTHMRCVRRPDVSLRWPPASHAALARTYARWDPDATTRAPHRNRARQISACRDVSTGARPRRPRNCNLVCPGGQGDHARADARARLPARCHRAIAPSRRPWPRPHAARACQGSPLRTDADAPIPPG